ncbi:Uncharacterised protein [Burkholderia pseudomallei]|nr:Uncharacterised protein [Burkholderia pseudomallei]
MSDTPLAPPLAPRDAAVIDAPPPARSPEPVRAPQPPSTMPRTHVAKTNERPHREPAIARRTLVETSAPPRTADGHRPHRRPAPRSTDIDLGQRHHRDERAIRRPLFAAPSPQPQPLDATHGRRPPPAPPARTSITRHRPWPTPSSRRTRHRTTTLRSTFTAAAAARRHAQPTATAPSRQRARRAADIAPSRRTTTNAPHTTALPPTPPQHAPAPA